MKKLSRILRGGDVHWVGDGFPVRTIFSAQSLGSAASPFLLLDYAGPADFAPSDKPRGVGPHPHRGFETVTIIYSGEVEHRDSTGGGGRIGPGGVQWMTAASGLVHEEFHGREFTKFGGTLEMIQLWVNLPAKDRSGPPHYQSIVIAEIPEVSLPEGAGRARVIAGSLDGVRGPAKTLTPVNLWDLRLNAESNAELTVPDGDNTLVFVLKGEIELAGGEIISDADLALFDPQGDSIILTARDDAKLLIMDGEPINEPIVAHGPFVMNSEAEILQAIDDYRNGRMGHLAGVAVGAVSCRQDGSP
ncbi:MAG TPA: pirin family protein [Lacipirellulaceae bacterium]|nr:pirin family protein [Lacipirellulaceae bacterium]